TRLSNDNRFKAGEKIVRDHLSQSSARVIRRKGHLSRHKIGTSTSKALPNHAENRLTLPKHNQLKNKEIL
ncbi:hypothetical protein, partial [Pseudomonas aeruginosa]|uniref:hypothetical protein n=1 Tax=Pseudomonas aeruginosa TaxID=287 RepID=UPI0031B6B63F